MLTLITDSYLFNFCDAFMSYVNIAFIRNHKIPNFMASVTITDYRVRELNIFQAEEFAEMDIR